MKNLVFVKATGGVIFEPEDVEDVFIQDGIGAVHRGQPIVKSYKKTVDRSEYSTLLIKKEDIADASSALNWASDGTFEFALNPKGSPQAGGTIKVEIPGRFSPSLSADDLSKIIEDWRLLSPHYSKFQDIFQAEPRGKFFDACLNYLLNSQKEIIDILSEMGTEVKEQLKAITPPPWIARVAELRKAKKQIKGGLNHG